MYIIALINIEDRETYARYEAGFGDIFAQYSGRMLAVDETAEVIEGEWPYTRIQRSLYPVFSEKFFPTIQLLR